MWFFSLLSDEDEIREQHSLDLHRQFLALRWLISIFVFLLFAPRFLNLYVDALWFDSLQYTSVFWFEWRAKVTLFFVFFLLTFGILKGAFNLLQRAFGKYALGGALTRFDGRPLALSPDSFMKPLAWGISLTWALLFGAIMSARWELWALFWNQVPTAERDPIFNKPISFYLFSWPVWDIFSGWLFGLAILIFLAAALWALMTYISKLPRLLQEEARRVAFLATAISLAGVLLTWASRLYLARFSLLWKGDEIYTGIGYVQAHITLPSHAILIGVLLLCAMLALWNASRKRSLKIFVVCLALPFSISIVSALAANYVSNFVVKPNQLALEAPYIQHNIDATRQSFALDRIAARDFPVQGDAKAIQAGARAGQNSSAQTAQNPGQSTLDNVRLWDWRALQATLTSTQALRTYYEFPDVDVDRYIVNGRARQVMIAARELNTTRLPETSRNWINEKLIYTHGYGVVMNTASEFTPEGRPRFLVSDMPLKFSAPEIKVTRPEIYFGQLTRSHVYVKTAQQEFDYPRGGKDSLSTYEGTGGVALGGFFRRTALAWALGDLSTIPFSEAVSPLSRVLLYRQINERAGRIAPFLDLDDDPYIVVDKAGRLKWMLDAYTTSLYRPYATHYLMGTNWTNYARNSVKIVVDAYNGSVDFYVFEPKDPIIQTWRKIYPALFKDASEMPADLRSHVRYPETLFRTQSEVYGLYHTTEPNSFFSRNDQWSVARLQDNDKAPNTVYMGAPAGGFPTPGIPGAMSNGAEAPVPSYAPGRNGDSTIDPYFLLAQLPLDSEREEFLLSVPFTSIGRPLNLSGWLAARSDGENYGQLALYAIPQTQNINAPRQILTRINQDGELSKLISLWNQKDSSVLWGNLLVLPVGRGLLYVQPIFLQSTNSPLPELRTVVLATQDKIYFAPTYEEALEKLLGDTTSAPADDGGIGNIGGATRSTPAATGASRRQLIERAARDLADYQTFTSQGKYAQAGAKLESLRRSLEALKTAR